MKKNFKDLKKDFVSKWREAYEKKQLEILSTYEDGSSLDLETIYDAKVYKVNFEDEEIQEEIENIRGLYSHETIEWYNFYDFLCDLGIEREELENIDESIVYDETGIYECKNINEIYDFIDKKYEKSKLCIKYELLHDGFEILRYNNFIINKFGNIEKDYNY